MIRKIVGLLGLLPLLWGAAAPRAAALPMGPRQIADFERESLDVLRWLMNQPHQDRGDRVIFTVRDATVKGFRVKEGEAELEGLTPHLRTILAAGQAGFDQVRALSALHARATLSAAHLQEFIDREIAKAHGHRKIFESVATRFRPGLVEVSGRARLDRIPGNVLSFLAQDPSPFTATVRLGIEGDHLVIDILEAQVNGQPMTPELRTQVLGWLNPLWDFSQLPYPARLETLEITAEGISASGWLFAP